MTRRVAIVVQRCHPHIVGGSEALAWQWATLLRETYETEVLTTRALDYSTWANVLPAGVEEREGVRVRRFDVTTGRSHYWGRLYARLLKDFQAQGGGGAHKLGRPRFLPWSAALQEEFIRQQGPYSAPMLDYLRTHQDEYRAIIFVTYLYPTAYFGLRETHAHTALFAPTLHDEPPAYLAAYRHAARRASELLWLTDAERRLGEGLWGELPGRVVSMAVETRPRVPVEEAAPYVLYCGRIDPNKGCARLFEHFARFKDEHPSDLRLVLIGEQSLPIPARPDVEYRGFATHEEKFALMAGALLFVMPSDNESFSIVTMEAMAQSTPVLSSGGSEVLVDHVLHSGAGRVYRDYETFAASLTELLADRDAWRERGARGRVYTVARYSAEHVRARLVAAVEATAERRAATTTETSTTHTNMTGTSALISKTQTTTAREATPPTLVLPAGWSENSLRELLMSVQVEGGRADELRNYAASDFRRFLYTLALVPAETHPDILELGANPYFFTVLLRKFRDARLELANFFGGDEAKGDEQRGSQDVFLHLTGETLTCVYQHFNMEQDAFPYADDSFDVVLFCEIIEHLLADPVHALSEIKRVLRPSGHLILTTPNAARLDNVARLLAGENIYDPYSGFGPYGRHNREYTTRDLQRLLEANGLRIETLYTADVNDTHASTPEALDATRRLVAKTRTDLADLGQYIFCRALVDEQTKLAPPVRPAWLYHTSHKPRPHITLTPPPKR
ncbi:MAG TPA: glycosyltransferase [Pyrinomonadaceae bacterium]|nr:glycosyltransferase [Pyrinomonadaceae bacterium]